MKELLLSAITLRLRLIRTNKSYIKGEQIEQFIVNLKYWLQNRSNLKSITERFDKEIRIILPNNFIKKYEENKKKLANVE